MSIGPLPAELQRWSYLNPVQRGPHEWVSACPQCGDAGHRGRGRPDRFRMWDSHNKPGVNARGKCRQCEFFEWADEDHRPTEAERAQAQQERRVWAEAKARRQRLRLAALARSGLVAKLAEQRRSNPEAIRLWSDEHGIAEGEQEAFSLGWTPNHSYWFDRQRHLSSALSIPVFAGTGEPINIHYRLLDAPPEHGKYRYTAGLTPPLYVLRPEHPFNNQSVIVVEGAKKAIVVGLRLGHEYSVVGLPSANPNPGILEPLSTARCLYVVLDPDAFVTPKVMPGQPARRSLLRRLLPSLPSPYRIVKMPVKPDDFFWKYGGSADDFRAYLALSRPGEHYE